MEKVVLNMTMSLDGLVDVAALLLGKGMRLFDHLHLKPTELETIKVIQDPSVPINYTAL